MTTETQQVWDLPDGTRRASISLVPERTEVDGAWVDLDPTLEMRADGSLAPVQVIGDVWVSGGGSAGSTIASYSGEEFSYSVASPFALPTPTVHGEHAVFSDVLPGVDLVVVTNVLGFSHNWVVTDEAAADDPRIAELDLPVEMVGLTPQRDAGGVSYVDADGVRQLWSATPVMWDSRGSEEPLSPLEAVRGGPAESNAVASVATRATSTSLRLRPDEDLLSDPEAVFPIVVDPPVNRVRNGWTAVWSNFPNKSFWQTEHSLGAGFEGWEQNKIVRSYFRFNTSVLSDKLILSAEVNVRQIHQASCLSRRTDMYRTRKVGTGTTWNKQPKRMGLQDWNSSTAGCGSGTKMVGWNVKKGTQAIASEGASSGTFMIRGHNESDRMGWKQFDDNGANLDVTYLSRPKAPRGIKFRSKSGNKVYSCGTGKDPRVIGETSIYAMAKLYSPDGAAAKLRGVVQFSDDGAKSVKLSGSHQPSGSQIEVPFKLKNGHFYAFRIRGRAYATAGTSGASITGPYNTNLHGPSHTWCYFRVDTSAPPAPTVTGTDFTECATVTEPELCEVEGSVGQAGQLTFTAAGTDTVRYEWQFNGGPVRKVATSAGAARSVTAGPDRVLNRVRVWAVDQAGNRSPQPTEFVFVVTPRRAQLRWTFNQVPAGANSGTVPGGDLAVDAGAVSELGRHERGLALSGSPLTTGAGPSASEPFTVAAWVHTPVGATSTSTVLTAGSGDATAFSVEFDPVTSQWSAGSVTGPRVQHPAVPGVWTHVAVSYTGSSKRVLRLTVNGRQVDIASATLGDSAGWRVGCAASSPGPCADVLLDEIAVFDGLVVPDDLRAEVDLLGHEDVPAVGSAGVWDMDEADDATSASDARFGWHMALSDVPSPAFGLSEDGEVASVLRLPGSATQEAATSVPVVDTTASFTTMVRVRPTDGDRTTVIAEHHAASGERWTLGYRPASEDTGQWVFQKTNAGVVEGETVSVIGPYVEDWTLLTAVYDAKTESLQLFTNVVPSRSGADTVVTPSASGGAVLRVGNGQFGGSTTAPFSGEIDYVETFVGAMHESTLKSIYFGMEGPA